MSNSTNDLFDLFGDAVSAGVISPATSTLLTGDLGNVVIAGAAGKDAEEIEATDVTLITILLDKSTSIGSRDLEQAVRDGYNMMIDTFLNSRERDSILTALWLFNDKTKVMHSYVPVADATTLDKKNYRSSGWTALYDVWCNALAANVAYAQRLRDGGTPTRSVVVVITDGEDTGSKRTLADCAQVSKDLLASEQFVLAFVGVGDEVDFHSVARGMGIPDGSIAVQAQASPSGMRRVFQMVSQSAIMVSSNAVAPGIGVGFFN